MIIQGVCCGPVWAEVQEERKFTVDVTVNQNWVSGPGAAQSWLQTGHAFVGSNYSYTYRRTDGDKKFSFMLNGRSTDDQSVDKQTWSLSNMTVNWADARKNFTLGDVMVSYSGYSMSAALKGASLELLPATAPDGTSSPQVSMVHGISYPRWENFWGGADMKAIKRTVSGFNVRQAGKKADFGISAVRSDDSGRLAGWDQLYQNNVYSLNWELRPREGTTIQGETAFSRTTQSPSDGEPDRQFHGYAHQVNINHRARHQRWQYEYELVSPDFTSLLGAAIVDRERMKLRWTGALNPDLSVSAGLAWSHDNLPGSARTYQTTLYQPELLFTFISPFKREAASLDLGVRLDRRFDPTTSTADRTATVNYRDTFGKIDADLSFDYQFSDTAPYDSGYKNRYTSFNISLASSINKTGYTLKPSLNVGYTRNRDFISHYNDRTFEASVGMGYQRASDNLSINFRVGKNQNLKESTPDTGRWFGSLRVDAQPKYLKALNPNATQFLEVNINTYKFDDAGNNYRETSVATGVHLEF